MGRESIALRLDHDLHIRVVSGQFKHGKVASSCQLLAVQTLQATFQSFEALGQLPAYKRQPGLDIEREKEEIIAVEGVNVIAPIQKEMKEIADTLGIDFELKR